MISSTSGAALRDYSSAAVHRTIEDTTFLLIANGNQAGPPASGFRDVLVARGARSVITHHHPLGPEEQGRHELIHYAGGRARRRVVRLPSRPPFTYPIDLVVPPRLPAADVVIAFNCLHAARALAGPRRSDQQVVYYAVDFVPDRFGRGTALTRSYDALDAWGCRNADARWEVSQRALDARDARHGLGPEKAPASAVPIGTWVERAPKAAPDAHRDRRVIFIGHLVERMGADTAVEAIGLLRARGVEVACDIAGHGPEARALQDRARALGIEQDVAFHGFVGDAPTLEALLARAAIGLAPYRSDGQNFTQYADPSKLKSYLAAGLPILLTDVPPNAGELAGAAGAEIVADDPAALAGAIERLLDDPLAWAERREAAMTYAHDFDWFEVVARALEPLGIR